ncbi:MAG: hypothetical protein IPH88_10365 [Bacteroidales bacterium]|nr:hypothetical protein [Bacteroidales bacterium]
MSRALLIVLILGLLNSCSTNPKTSKGIIDNQLLQDFISKQHILQLPLRIDLYQPTYNLSKLDDTDSLIFKDGSSVGCLGILSDTSQFYYIIRMFPGDDLCPVLYILNKNGIISDKANLYIGKYGFDCGTHLYGYTSIGKDLRIYTQDSLVQYKCDSVGKEGEVPIKSAVGTQEMSIINGKIEQLKFMERTPK